jgi:hypothetical protein
MIVGQFGQPLARFAAAACVPRELDERRSLQGAYESRDCERRDTRQKANVTRVAATR